MQLGYMAPIQFEAHESFVLKMEHSIKEVARARECGFKFISVGQHHVVSPYLMPSLWPYLGRLTAETKDMTLLCGVTLLPLHNPVDIAEQVMTLDALTGGRFVCGIGLGYRDEEFLTFGVERETRVPRLLESLEILRLVWTQEEVEFSGRYWSVPRTKISTKPIQKPHPPIWIAANADAAVERVGRLGLPWLINPHVTLQTLVRQNSLYQDALKRAGHSHPGQIPLIREVFVHEDEATAWRLAEPHLYSKYQAYANWGQEQALPENESFNIPFKDLARDRFIIGTPTQCLEEIARYEKELGVNILICRIQWPGVPHSQVLHTLDLLGTEVIPQLTS